MFVVSRSVSPWLLLLLTAATTSAFHTVVVGGRTSAVARTRRPAPKTAPWMSSDSNDAATTMLEQAKKLRAEAEALEKSMAAERTATLEAELAEFFESADANGDGVVTLEELTAALRKRLVDENENARAAARLESTLEGGSLEKILKDLDANADGVLQLEEMISVQGFRERLEESFRESKEATLKETAKATVEKAVAEKFDAFDVVANSTNVSARLGALFAYALPLLDGVPVDILTSRFPPNPLSVTLVSAWATYRNFPASGLLAFFALSVVASNAAAPRLVRFAARHAIILDFVAALLLPLLYRFVPEPYDLATAIVFEFVVVTCALVGFVLARDADFVPGTGTLTKKFTDDFDTSIRSFLRATTTAELGAFVADDDDDADDQASSKEGANNATSSSGGDVVVQEEEDPSSSEEKKKKDDAES